MSSKKPVDKRKSDSKNQPLTKTMYKLPPKEMIVTRNKSAQLKDKTNNTVTGESQPKTTSKTKSPVKTYASRKRQPKANQTTTKTSNTQPEKESSMNTSEEFRPDNPKRDVSAKKVTLKPKQGLREIASLNKRKRNIPRQNSSYVTKVAKVEPKKGLRKVKTNVSAPKKAKPAPSSKSKILDPYSGLSMSEIIRLKDETEVLTDEDFMAILTCPSPVWWEENLEGVNDEPIRTIKQMRSIKSDDKEIVQEVKALDAELDEVQDKTLVVPEIHEGKFEEKFLKKRSLLENVLSNIKGNTHSKVQPQKEARIASAIAAPKNDPTSLVAKIDSELKTTNERTQLKKATKTEPIFLNKVNSNKVVFKTIKKIVPYRVPDSKIKEKERDSPSIESSLIDELALKGLENMNIPMAKEAELTKNIASPTYNTVLIDKKLQEDPCCSKSIDGILTSELDATELEIVDVAYDSLAKDPLEAPTVLPTLQKCPITTSEIEISESYMPDSIDTHSNTSLQDLSDTMSDTNIQFISEDQNLEDEGESRNVDDTPIITDPEEVVADPDKVVADPDDVVADPDEVVAYLEKVVADPDGVVADTDEIVAYPDEIVADPDEVIADPEEVVAYSDEVVADTDEAVAGPDDFVVDPDEVVAENDMMVDVVELKSNTVKSQGLDVISSSKNDSAKPNAKNLFFLKSLRKLRLDPKNGKKQQSLLKPRKIHSKVSKSKAQIFIVGTKTKKGGTKLVKFLKDPESYGDKDVQSNFTICEMQKGILRINDDITTQDPSDDRDVYEDKDAAKTTLKDKENVKSADEVTEKNGVTDTQNGDIDKTLIIEKYSSILKKKFSDKTKRKLKNSNTDNHDAVSSKVSNELDMTVYTGVVNGQKTLTLTGNRTGIVGERNETESVGHNVENLTTKTSKKSISLSDKKHYNYCMHCSSIFDDTEVCTYCIKKCIDDRIIKNVASCTDCG